jgi:hypothetical protein
MPTYFPRRRRATSDAAGVLALGLLSLAASLHVQARAETPSNVPSNQARSVVMQKVQGSFDVKLTPEGSEDKAGGSSLGRMSIEKQFHGALDGTSKGQMLTGSSEVAGSAGYVALERVTATLKGRRGSFLLQHSGTMSKAAGYQLSITVVPDSGSGELVGLAGKLDIQIVEGKHLYTFEYSLPDAP